MDRFAHKQSATRRGERQRLLPDARICGGEVSWCPQVVPRGQSIMPLHLPQCLLSPTEGELCSGWADMGALISCTGSSQLFAVVGICGCVLFVLGDPRLF